MKDDLRRGLEQRADWPLNFKAAGEINPEALASVLFLGHTFSGLDASGIATPVGKFSVRRRQVEDYCAEETRGRTRDEWMELYQQTLWRVIERLPANRPTVMGLSGGHDSRHILLTLHAMGRSIPRLVTSHHFLGASSEGDVLAAGTLAKKLGHPIEVVFQPRDRFRAEWDKNRATALGALDHSWGPPLARALDGPEMLLDGMNGGVLLGRNALTKALVQRFGPSKPAFPLIRDFLLKLAVDDPAESINAWLKSPLIGSEDFQSLREKFSKCIARYEAYPNPLQALTYFEAVQYTTRLFTRVLMRNKHITCPLDSPEILRLALSMPFELSSDRLFQRDTISRYYPEFADVPYAHSVSIPPSALTETDQQSEATSWLRIRNVLSPHLSGQGAGWLDSNRDNLKIIQQTTLLAQAFLYHESGQVPAGADFFRENAC